MMMRLFHLLGSLLLYLSIFLLFFIGSTTAAHRDVFLYNNRGRATALPLVMSSCPGWHSSTHSTRNRTRRCSRGRRSPSSALMASTSSSRRLVVASTAGVFDEQEQVVVDRAPATWDDLSFPQKLVAGTLQVGMEFVVDYIRGFFAGYFCSAIVGIGPLCFSNAGGPTVRGVGHEIKARVQRYGAKNWRWATQWAPISSVFGGTQALSRVLRDNKQDEWNAHFSAAMAGAYFGRKGGPQGMLKGAATYGGLSFLITKLLVRNKPEDVEEVVVVDEVEF